MTQKVQVAFGLAFIQLINVVWPFSAQPAVTAQNTNIEVTQFGFYCFCCCSAALLL